MVLLLDFRLPHLIFSLLVIFSIVGCSVHRHENQIHNLYIVQKGDTLSQIARKFGVSLESLVETNNINNPEKIIAGTLLKIRPSNYSNQMASDKNKYKRISLGLSKKYIGKLSWPCDSKVIISSFGWRGSRFHEGIDIKGEKLSPVFAAHSGKVVFDSDNLRGYGNAIAIKSDGIMTFYGHLERSEVTLGEYVEQGKEIGLIGSTGLSAAPHLHFETRIKDHLGLNVAVDPQSFYKN